MSNQCHQCGSYAINHQHHGRDGSEPDLCDVCFWHSRHDQLKADSEVVTGLVESRLAENLRLKAENERLKLRLWDLEHSEVDHVLKERDTLRKQLDEACELLNDSRNKINYMMQNGELYQPQFLLERIDAWLEENKP